MLWLSHLILTGGSLSLERLHASSGATKALNYFSPKTCEHTFSFTAVTYKMFFW